MRYVLSLQLTRLIAKVYFQILTPESLESEQATQTDSELDERDEEVEEWNGFSIDEVLNDTEAEEAPEIAPYNTELSSAFSKFC